MDKFSSAKEKLIVALDFDNMKDCENLVNLLGNNVEIYKVGLESFLCTNGGIIDYLHKNGKKVFLDLKFHDITNTVKRAVEYAINKNVFMFNIHCSNGLKTMEEIKKLAEERKSNSLLIGVTILTNLGNDDLYKMFQSPLKLEDIVINLATLAKKTKLNGIVCSPMESKLVKEKLGKDFITVCPGVRPKFTLNENGKSSDDQNRIMTPFEAMENNVDFLVIGRPITKAENPLEVTKLILKEMTEGIK